MGSNLENDRSVTTGKIYPIDLAPQKITIVKSVTNPEVKMAHLMTGQTKTSSTGQIITHSGPLSLMRPASQIISSGVATQPQMIVSGSPILQGTQIVSQGTQIISQGSQIISQPQLLGPTTLLTQSTQIISQGSQTNVSGNQNMGNAQVTVTPVSGAQVLNVSGQIGNAAGLLVNSSVRALSPSVRVLPPLPHHNTRPVLSSVGLGSGNTSVVVNKGITTHVPRGPTAAASLAVPRVATRPITPASAPVPISIAGTWSPGVRGTLVYSARATGPRGPPRMSAPTSQSPMSLTSPAPAHSTIVTLPTSTVFTTGGVIAASVRAISPRVPVTVPTGSMPVVTPTVQRPLPLLQRNYQPAKRTLPLLQRNYQSAKVVGVASVGMRAPVGNSAPSQLYYEVSRPPTPHTVPPAAVAMPRVLTPYNHVVQPPAQVSMANAAVQLLSDNRTSTASVLATTALPRPSILRKRDIDGSPTKNGGVGQPVNYEPPPPPRVEEPLPVWTEDVSSMKTSRGSPDGSGGGSTTVSAASSPAPDDDLPSPPRVPTPPHDISPRKKPRKQTLSSAMRQCDFSAEEAPRTPPPAPAPPPPPKRPLLSSSFVCGWRATALHFTRPTDVKRREPRAKDIVALANQKHILHTAKGWKVHHFTAQMDDLVSLESDVSEQLSRLLRSLEATHGKAQAALAPHHHSMLELVKGNIQRSNIVREGINESRNDILRVFTHRKFVADILTRQADKRSFRKHRVTS